MTEKTKILVVDDEQGIRNLLGAMLEKRGYKAVCLENAEEALRLLPTAQFELAITDLRLPGISGEKLLEKFKQSQPNLPVVVISGYGNTKNVVEVIKKGAEDYLSKPFTAEELEAVVLKALEKRRLLTENERLRREAAGRGGPLIGQSKAAEMIRQLVRKFASSGASVLITGESGVGKELAAKAIHDLSPRSRGPLVLVNAGTLPSALFEAELFGVRKGAYTGATETRKGLFQAADQGTLFLDEIAEVPLESQAKLLRAFESGDVRAIGDSKTTKVDVRVVTATNQNLEEWVRMKKFRQDLFYRLSVLRLHIPPLRERRDDIPLLVDHFLGLFSTEGKGPKRISAEALKWLMAQEWPGNIRELKNVLERAVLLTNGDEVKKENLFLSENAENDIPTGLFRQIKKVHMAAFEKKYLQALMENSGGNVSEAARRSGLARRNFQVLLKRHALKPSDYKK